MVVPLSMLLDETYLKKLGVIEEFVKNLWKGNRGLPRCYTIHDASHSGCVEKAVHKLIPGSKYSCLTEEEKFYLLASAWLHDIGMIPDLFGIKEKYKIVRSDHHNRSVKYILKDYKILGLDNAQARKISEICKYHRKSEDINGCRKVDGDVRLQLLASYLRLADAIHIDKSRFDESLFKIFLESGMPWDSKYHWLKSSWIEYVKPNFEDLTITIKLLLNKRDAENVDIIINMIEEDVLSELYTVKDILIRGGISYFLDVKIEEGLGIADDQKLDLEQIIGNYQLIYKPSASDVMEILVETLLSILKSEDRNEAYSTVKAYQKEIIIKDIIKNRPCHVLVRRLNDIIEKNMSQDREELSDNETMNKIEKTREEIEKFQSKRNAKLEELLRHTKTIMADFGSILLFGYSNLVIKALADLQGEIKKNTKIYVCECSGKNQYNDRNELIYCDGIEYAAKIIESGCQKVYLIPDILVANLISRSLISKVIFGANGVDSKEGNFGHTGGHLTIADVAYEHKVPVYVILDSYKFGKMEPNEKLERKIPWITGDNKALKRLKGIELFNPKEDIVPKNKLYALVTDYGIFPPSKIPEIISKGD